MTDRPPTNAAIMAELMAMRAEGHERGEKTDAMYQALMVQPQEGQPTLLAELQELAGFARHGRWGVRAVLRLLFLIGGLAVAATAIETFIINHKGPVP